MTFHRPLVAALLSILAVGAQAHAHLLGSAPAADSSIAVAPSDMRLDFSETVDVAFSGASLSTASGAAIATGPTHLAGDGDKSIVVPVPATLAPGTYTVEWHALAVDGHRTKGRYTFTIKP